MRLDAGQRTGQMLGFSTPIMGVDRHSHQGVGGG